jgi:cell division protein FtsI (penicillin-binding protein 3)
MGPRPIPFALPITLLGLLYAGLGARLVYLQGIRGPELAARAERMCRGVEEMAPPRGRILDRTGRVLAVSVPVSELEVAPREVRIAGEKDPRRVASLLAPVLGVPEEEVRGRIAGDRLYRRVARDLPQSKREAVERVLALHRISGFRFVEACVRAYPQGEILGHVLGHVDREGIGRSGVEQRFDALLRGEGGRRSFGRILPSPPGASRGIAPAEEETEPEPGSDLLLTVDAAVGAFAAEELARAAKTFSPECAVAIVLDPRDGAVLALESYPRFDPNRSEEYAPPYAEMMNRAVAWTYSPGSAFKPFVYAAGIEEGIFDPEERFACGSSGQAAFGPRIVRDHEPMGTLSGRDVLAHSSNIGMARIGLRLGIERTERWVRRFGFGQATGIELPGERDGVVHPRARWTENYSLVSVSFGYELTTTPIRLAASFCALANGGHLVPPTLLARPRDRARPRRVLSERTHSIVLDALGEVVRTGTGKKIRSERVAIAGKTGTTVKDAATRSGPGRRYTSTFVGFAPAEEPAALVLFLIDEPKGGKYYASDVAAPHAGRLLERTLAYLERIPPAVALAAGGTMDVRLLPAPVGISPERGAR